MAQFVYDGHGNHVKKIKPDGSKSFLQAGTVSGCGGFIGGVCGTWGDPSISKDIELKDFALQPGLFSPQVGVSATFGLLVSDK